MPYTMTIVDNGKGLHKIGTGIVTGAEILSVSLHDADDEQAVRRLRYALLDFSQTSEMILTAEDMYRIVESNRKTSTMTQGGMVAVVSPTDMSYGMSRMWHSLSFDFGWERNLFRNRPDAIAWLRSRLITDNPDEFPSLV